MHYFSNRLQVSTKIHSVPKEALI